MPSSPSIPKVGQHHHGDGGDEGTDDDLQGSRREASTHQSVNSGSLFHPQEVKKACSSSTWDLEPFLWHEGHRNQLSLGGGRPAEGGTGALVLADMMQFDWLHECYVYTGWSTICEFLFILPSRLTVMISLIYTVYSLYSLYSSQYWPTYHNKHTNWQKQSHTGHRLVLLVNMTGYTKHFHHFAT